MAWQMRAGLAIRVWQAERDSRSDDPQARHAARIAALDREMGFGQ